MIDFLTFCFFFFLLLIVDNCEKGKKAHQFRREHKLRASVPIRTVELLILGCLASIVIKAKLNSMESGRQPTTVNL